MQIKVTALSELEKNTKGKNSWFSFKATYENDKGTTGTKNFVSFDPIWADAKVMEVGKSYSVRVEKEGSNWVWKSIAEVEGGAAQQSPRSGGSNANPTGKEWETRDERNARQRYIMRQSSVSNAIEFYKLHSGSAPAIEEVLQKAEEIYDYVSQQTKANVPSDEEVQVD